MKDIKPGNTVLVKCRVERVVSTVEETVYLCVPYSSDKDYYDGYTQEKDIMVHVSADTTRRGDLEITFDGNLNPIRGRYKYN